MKLEQLMEGVPFTLVQGSLDTEIADIIYDSRKAAPGLLFVCIVGTQRDSHAFAADCAAKGVSALVIQHDIDLTVAPGETVAVRVPAPQETVLTAQDIPLDVVYEDEDVIVVNKPTGMVVHPAPGHPDGTLVNALLHHCGDSLSGVGGEKRPGIVHRIDRDTSGLIIAAKNDTAHLALSAQLADHTLARTYECLAVGNFREDSGTVDAPIGRHPTDRKKMAVYPSTEPHTKYAYTGYRVLERLGEFTMLECRLKTGRTHQIRVHMASIHHPVAGDPVYGPHNCITSLHGQCLHAKTLGFVHPITGEHLRFDSELPDYFTRFLTTLRQRTGGNNE